MSDLYKWNLAPVCDAFAPSAYPPPVSVNPDHVGYRIERYQEGKAMGLVIRGFYRLEEAQELADLLNTNPEHPRVKGLPRREAYL